MLQYYVTFFEKHVYNNNYNNNYSYVITFSAYNLFASHTCTLFFSHDYSLFCSQPFVSTYSLDLHKSYFQTRNRNLSQGWTDLQMTHWSLYPTLLYTHVFSLQNILIHSLPHACCCWFKCSMYLLVCIMRYPSLSYSCWCYCWFTSKWCTYVLVWLLFYCSYSKTILTRFVCVTIFINFPLPLQYQEI